MFQGLWRRGRRGRKSALAPAVIPVVEALDKRQLLSGDVTLPVEVLTGGASTNESGPVQFVPCEPMTFPFWIPDDYQDRERVAPPPPAPRGIEFRDTGLDFLPVGADIYGTDGDDNIVITYDAAADGIRIFGVAGIEDGTLFTGISMLSVYAGRGNDTVRVDCGPNTYGWIYGEEGDDLLVSTGKVSGFSGGAGNDTLIGSEGSEQFYGGPGVDSIDGGGGYDVYRVDFGDRTAGGLDLDLSTGIVTNDGYGFQETFVNIKAASGPGIPVPTDIWTPEGTSGVTVVEQDMSPTEGTTMAALATPRATAAAKLTPAQARKQKLLLAKQRKAKLLKLKQAKLAAKKAELAQKRAELAEKRAEIAERRAEARRQDN